MSDPREIHEDEMFSIEIPMPIPCCRCGVDLRGKTVALINPRVTPERDACGEPVLDEHGVQRTVTVYDPACESCAERADL